MNKRFERLTRQFYEWEIYGRGWLNYEYPVDLEPAFHPFFGHEIEQEYIDDGICPTLLDRFFNLIAPSSKSLAYSKEEEEFTREAYQLNQDSELIALGILLPNNFPVKSELMEHLIIMLSFCEQNINQTIVKGYRVKVEYNSGSLESEKSKRENILKTITRKPTKPFS